ncbi:uncharacterized protein LOC143042977 [Mytilus galloprovincialis]|uniref:uncharacterized protein LOC143042977 n=1 Tax=Mytilus galloprovincialis TaxID=29158 RepID=UPI003F7B8F17
MLKNIQEMIGENSVIGTLTQVIVAFEMKYTTHGTMNGVLLALYVLLVLTMLTQRYIHRSTERGQNSEFEEKSTSENRTSFFSKLTFGYCTKAMYTHNSETCYGFAYPCSSYTGAKL